MTQTLIEEGTAFLKLEGQQLHDRAGTRPARAEADAAPAPRPEARAERHHVLVIGAGQAGLSVGYHLAQRGIPFMILDAGERVGDQWRRRWDSLRLFTPALF